MITFIVPHFSSPFIIAQNCSSVGELNAPQFVLLESHPRKKYEWFIPVVPWGIVSVYSSQNGLYVGDNIHSHKEEFSHAVSSLYWLQFSSVGPMHSLPSEFCV